MLTLVVRKSVLPALTTVQLVFQLQIVLLVLLEKFYLRILVPVSTHAYTNVQLTTIIVQVYVYNVVAVVILATELQVIVVVATLVLI